MGIPVLYESLPHTARSEGGNDTGRNMFPAHTSGYSWLRVPIWLQEKQKKAILKGKYKYKQYLVSQRRRHLRVNISVVFGRALKAAEKRSREQAP